MKQKRARIGFATAGFREPYQMTIWTGVLDAAVASDSSLMYLCGGRLHSPVHGESPGNIIYSIASPESLDGIIALSTTVGTFLGAEELRLFCASFAPLPVVSMGIAVDGFPFAIVDNADGMRALVRHLIDAHGYRRFAYISGPSLHQEANLRLKAFTETLDVHGLHVDPRLIAHCDFNTESGKLAVETFAARGLVGHKGVDAIVAANDRMALAAIEALEMKGIRVPEDIAVVGFDDIDDGRYVTPSLTTVRQPLFELGKKAFELILTAVHGRKVESAVLTPELVVRESCGCPSATIENIGRRIDPGLPEGVLEADRSALLESLHSCEYDAFLSQLSALLQSRHGSHLRPADFHDLLSTLRAEVIGDDSNCRQPGGVGQVLERARVLVGEIGYRHMAFNNALHERQTELVRALGTSLLFANDRQQLLESISRGIQDLGIPRCYISLYEGSEPLPEFSRLILAAPSEPPHARGCTGRRFRTRRILPRGVIDTSQAFHVMILPLHFDTQLQGFLVFEYADGIPQFYDDIRNHIASALRMRHLIEMIRDHEVELEREVEAKTLQHTRSNRRLKREMHRRRLLEGEIITISGEVMERVGQDLHDGLSQKLAALSMLASALESRLSAESHADAAAARDLVAFLNQATVDAKEIARGLYPVELERNGFIPAIQELVSSSRRLFDTEVSLYVKGMSGKEDASKAIQMFRIVQEALGNALKHSHARLISLVIECHEDQVTVEIVDDGIGIPDDLSETTGMGLRIMRYRANMIEASLSVERLEKGTRISLSADVAAPSGRYLRTRR